MKIKEHSIKIEDLFKGFTDNEEEGVFCYKGKLNIRPPYQREMVYNDKQQVAVINSVIKKYPLNVFYWAEKDDGSFEMIDGQQRTMSICKYLNGDFIVNDKFWNNLLPEEQKPILETEIKVYFCKGTDKEILDWFEVINFAGEKLTDQELNNAIYSGPWVSSAKEFFSKSNCQAYRLAGDYLKGSAIRQEYLETAIKWQSNDDIRGYMAKHQNDKDANELWEYFKRVFEWKDEIFTTKDKRNMNGVPWGHLYNEFKDEQLDPISIDKEIEDLLLNSHVQKKKGVYQYVLSKEEKYLNLRQFPENIKMEVYKEQDQKCYICEEEKEYSQVEADHDIPWWKDGPTTKENCRVLCIKCNREKSGK